MWAGAGRTVQGGQVQCVQVQCGQVQWGQVQCGQASLSWGTLKAGGHKPGLGSVCARHPQPSQVDQVLFHLGGGSGRLPWPS